MASADDDRVAMSDMLRRLHDLPWSLRDGRLTNCALTVAGGRIRFREPEQQWVHRRLHALRRRMRRFAFALLCFVGVLLVPSEEARVSLAIIGLAALLAALRGLGSDVAGRGRRFEFAVLDAVRGEVDLLSPHGRVLTAELSDVRMFLLVADAERGLFHLGVVLGRDLFLPWMSTSSGGAAASLTWLFGHLSGRPAMGLEAPVPFPAGELDRAEPLGPPPAELLAPSRHRG